MCKSEKYQTSSSVSIFTELVGTYALLCAESDQHSTRHLAQQIIVARFSVQDGTTSKMLDRISRVLDDHLDYIKTLKEHRDQIVDILRNSPIFDEENLLHTIEMYCKFRTEAIAMVDNPDVLKEHLKKANYRSKFKKFLFGAIQFQNGSFQSHQIPHFI